MNEPEFTPRGGRLLRLLRFRPRLAAWAAVGLFLYGVAQFHDRDTGFSSLLSIGEVLGNSKVTALRQVPHYVYEGSAGYDGAYYVQLALHPTLNNPELNRAIDNLPYRAKRILLSWASWGAGSWTTRVDRAGACAAQCGLLAGPGVGVAAVVSAE
jgi:hypothetical protein